MASFLNEWVSVVRRARLGRTVKAVAYALALYANPDGRKVYPGIARLSVECELGTKVIKQSLKALRDAGLIEVVRPASRPGESTEYRLILAEDLLDRIEVPSPALHTMAIRDASESIRGKYTAGNLRGPGTPADDEPAGARDHETDRSAGALTPDLRGRANPATTHRPFQLDATTQTVDHLRTAVTVADPQVVDNVIRFPVERVA